MTPDAALITVDAADAPTSAPLDPPFEALSSRLNGVTCEVAATNEPFKRIAPIGGERDCGCSAFFAKLLIWGTRNW